MKKLKVLLVDDEIMIREGFKKLFDWEAHDCEVVGEAADGMEALAQIERKQYAAQLINRGISKEHIRSYGFAFHGKKVLIG